MILKKVDFSIYSAIIHLAALVHKNEKKIPIVQYLQVNENKTKELMEKAISDNVSHFIFISTMAVFGNKGKIYESTPLEPNTKYGKSKLIAEKHLIKNKLKIKLSIYWTTDDLCELH